MPDISYFETAQPLQPEPPSRPAPRPTASPFTITYALIALNSLVFLAMVATGVSFVSPSPLDVFRWGGDFGPATVGDAQWWRLFTSTFVLFGSLVSVWVHPNSVGAGASGAIFGLYGALFAFILTHRNTLAPAVTSSLTRSAGIFVLYNMVFGALNHTTDISAHLGGLLAGFLTGLLAVRRNNPIA